MKTLWLNKKNNPYLILFFNGWGMDEKPIEHLLIDHFDVLMVYDYSDLIFEENLQNYSTITLMAWSMGVLAASLVCDKLFIKKSIAINGTLNPIDAKFGINPKIFQSTLENFSEKTKTEFFKNMFLSEQEYEKLQKPNRDIENQRKELEFLQKTATKNTFLDFNFDYAIISNQDKIMPAKKQKNFWQTKKVKVIELNSGHYPFFEFGNLEEIINETLQ